MASYEKWSEIARGLKPSSAGLGEVFLTDEVLAVREAERIFEETKSRTAAARLRGGLRIGAAALLAGVASQSCTPEQINHISQFAQQAWFPLMLGTGAIFEISRIYSMRPSKWR